MGDDRANSTGPTTPSASCAGGGREPGWNPRWCPSKCRPVVAPSTPAGPGTGRGVNRSPCRGARSWPTACRRRPASTPTPTGYIYSRYKRFGDDTMDETFFPVTWRNDGYRSPFIEPYWARRIGWGAHSPPSWQAGPGERWSAGTAATAGVGLGGAARHAPRRKRVGAQAAHPDPVGGARLVTVAPRHHRTAHPVQRGCLGPRQAGAGSRRNPEDGRPPRSGRRCRR